MELIRQKIKDNKHLLEECQKEAIKQGCPDFKSANEFLGHPYIFTYFNYPEHSQNINLDVLLNKGDNEINLAEGIRIPLKENPVLQIIFDTDPRVNQKKLKLKNKEEIPDISHSLLAAIKLIRETDKNIYEDIVGHLRMIVLFDADYAHNFTINKIYNAIFLNPPKDASPIFFVDSLVHESSHNNLNLALHKFEDFFAINPLEKVFSSPFRKKDDKRGLFHVFHALFVVANLCNFYDLLYQKKDSDEGRNEILGRLLTNIKFLNLSIDEIDFEPFYKEYGLVLLNYFKETDKKMQDKYQNLSGQFILPNDCDNHIFSLQEFEKSNNLQQL